MILGVYLVDYRKLTSLHFVEVIGNVYSYTENRFITLVVYAEYIQEHEPICYGIIFNIILNGSDRNKIYKKLYYQVRVVD